MSRTACIIVAGWLACTAIQDSHGQQAAALGGGQLAPAVASTGQPFGVLSVEVPLPPEMANREPRIRVEDPQGRIFYPVVSIRQAAVAKPPRRGVVGRPGGLIDRVRSAIQENREPELVPVAVSVAALFRGQEPLVLQLSGDISQQIRFEPSSIVEAQQRERLVSWWNLYTTQIMQDIKQQDFPRLVHKYLVAMLSDRMGLPHVDIDPPDPDEQQLSKPLETLALLAAIEPLREQILEDVLTFEGDTSPASEPVPAEPQWLETIIPHLGHEMEVEAIASRVPPECFYARFGSFSNFVWFQELSERFGGDIGQAVLLRGFKANVQARMEQMLAAKMTTLAKMFGDSVIADMAVIGNDLYVKEGASLGVIFKARNPGLLSAGLDADRSAVAARNSDARVEELQIAGRRVRLLSTPDNRIRSFHVSDNGYSLITTSRRLMERFLEVGDNGNSLAASPAFQSARSWMPNANNYTIFAYFSPDFFQHLVSPQYQIELNRRLEAIAHLEIAELASQAARGEGLPVDDIGQLKQAGFLPRWFDERTDGAQTLRIEDKWIDSLRGARGSFMPISDVELSAVTSAEALSYTRTASYYQQEWGRMDPMVFGVRRFQGDAPELEKVTFEGYLAPFEADKYGWIARQLGAPTPVEIAMPADDAISVQAHVRGSAILGTSEYHLFGGIKDLAPPDVSTGLGLIKALQLLRSAPAYIGGWPKPGVIDQLPLGIGQALSQPDAFGYSKMFGGLWRWQDGAFSVLSFNRAILEDAVPQLAALEAEDMAQARLRVASLDGGQLADWINAFWYERGWKASQANARFLDTVHGQLKVPAEDCMQVAGRLLDLELQCPLGGSYEFREMPTANDGWWESSAWSEAQSGAGGKPLPPPNYKAPWIEWFRGGRVHVTQQPTSLSVLGEVMLELQPLPYVTSSQPMVLPQMDFDLFSLPGKLFGGQKDKEEQPKRKSF